MASIILAMIQEIRSDLPHLKHVFAVGGTGEAPSRRPFSTARLSPDAERQRLAAMRPEPNEVVELIYTSGTSGEPKAVMHTANTVLAPAQCFIDDIGLTGRDVIFMGSPYAHQTGFLYGMLMPVMLGTTTVALDAWSAADAVPLIEREGVTFSMGSTPFLSDMVNLPERLRARVSRTLRTWVCAGAPIPRVLVQRAKAEMNLDVLSCWGMTENAGLTITRKSDPQAKVFETDGRALPGNAVRVVDDASGPCRPTRSATCRRAASRISSAISRSRSSTRSTRTAGSTPATSRAWTATATSASSGAPRTSSSAAARTFRSPRWRTSSIGTRGVAECAVVAMPDERLGERACVFVILKADAPLDLAELTRFLAEQGMAKPYWPERLELLADMPRTPSGKIQKFKLREMAARLKA